MIAMASTGLARDYHDLIALNSSDGVVASWSSHLAEAKSELIVPGPHGSYALPETVTELKRILCLQLACAGAPTGSTVTPVKPGPADCSSLGRCARESSPLG
jgi:hypothetical protein